MRICITALQALAYLHFGAILEVASEKAEQDAVQGTGGTGKQNICSRHPLQGGGNDMIIRHALIHDAVHKEPYPGDILIRDGKLVSVGDPADAEDEILDAEGLHAGRSEPHDGQSAKTQKTVSCVDDPAVIRSP